MNLTVQERFLLGELLPKEESYAGMTEIYKLKIHLSISEEEVKAIELVKDSNGVRWNPEKATEVIKDVPMGEWITNIIRDNLREKNEKRKLQEKHMSLYEKFVVDYGMV